MALVTKTLTEFFAKTDSAGKKLVSAYAKATKKLAIFSSRKSFLIECKINYVYPQFINQAVEKLNKLYSTSLNDQKVHRFVENVKHRHLMLSLESTYKTIKHLKKERNHLERKLKKHLGRDLFLELRNFHEEKRLVEQKYCNLYSQTEDVKSDGDWFLNISNTDIPEEVSQFLGFGPKFCLNYDKIPVYQIIADCEDVITAIPNERERDLLRSQLVSIITNHISTHQQTKNGVDAKLLQMEKKTNNFFKNEPRINYFKV